MKPASPSPPPTSSPSQSSPPTSSSPATCRPGLATALAAISALGGSSSSRKCPRPPPESSNASSSAKCRVSHNQGEDLRNLHNTACQARLDLTRRQRNVIYCI